MKKDMKIQYLKKCIEQLANYPKHSRIHPLKTFTRCFVKRDDELSFGISGSKFRKYLSLLPYLKKEKIQEAILIGSAYSNNILSLSQLIIENEIKPTLFLLGNPHSQKFGNLLLTSLCVSKEQVHWINRELWNNVEHIAHEHARKQCHKVCVIPEGGCMKEALLGAASLAIDIMENEAETNIQFSHIFLDAGSGLTAIATLLVFAWIQKRTCLHIVLLADDENIFMNKLEKFRKDFEVLIQDSLPMHDILSLCELHIPKKLRSFGSTSSDLFKYIQYLARNEGFLTDPIYTAKLFLEAKRILDEKAEAENSLIVHSGGALSLLGFQEQLRLLIKD